MPRLTIVLDLPEVDATTTDPWAIADDLLDENLDTFFPGTNFKGKHEGQFVSAEWST
jgi:hypothetical protein